VEYSPGWSHREQVVAPKAANVEGGHSVQMLSTGIDPGLHPLQLEAPLGDTSLSSQSMQLFDPPKLYFEGAQATQELVKLSPRYPGPQYVHCELPGESLTKPFVASQLWHEAAPATANVEGGQMSHPVLLALGA